MGSNDEKKIIISKNKISIKIWRSMLDPDLIHKLQQIGFNF